MQIKIKKTVSVDDQQILWHMREQKLTAWKTNNKTKTNWNHNIIHISLYSCLYSSVISIVKANLCFQVKKVFAEDKGQNYRLQYRRRLHEEVNCIINKNVVRGL